MCIRAMQDHRLSLSSGSCIWVLGYVIDHKGNYTTILGWLRRTTIVFTHVWKTRISFIS